MYNMKRVLDVFLPFSGEKFKSQLVLAYKFTLKKDLVKRLQNRLD